PFYFSNLILQFALLKRGSEKAALHQVVRTAKQKQIFMFFVWLNLLPQMQVFEHRLLKKGCDNILS
ncbi:hypothetical protein ACYK6X_002704, partial [Enterococcus faecium]